MITSDVIHWGPPHFVRYKYGRVGSELEKFEINN